METRRNVGIRGVALGSAAAATAALFVAGSASAVIVLGNGDKVSLSEVFAQGSDRMVCIDDKLFNFESFASSQFAIGDYTLIGFVSQGTNSYGLHNVGFDLTGPLGDGSPGDGGVHEMNLQYSVAVKADAYERGVRLCDARLTFNGSAGGIGSFARVDETVFDLDANQLLGQLSVFDFFGPPPDTRLTDGRDFCAEGAPGFRAFEINKDLKFFAAQANGFATASFVRQEFSQVPAPGAVALIALAGIVGRRRRG